MKLLVVDDDQAFRDRLGLALTDRGFQVRLAASYEQAAELLSQEIFLGVVTDLRMPGASGLQVVQRARELQPACRVVVLTGYGSIATTVDAMRLGAHDYLVKPCSVEQLLATFRARDGERDERELASETPSLARLEREHIERVLSECEGNVSKTARVLGINRRTLQYKLAKYPVSR
jgi:two-component system response regulator RegA